MAIGNIQFRDGNGTLRDLKVDITGNLVTLVTQPEVVSSSSNVSIVNGANTAQVNNQGSLRVFNNASEPLSTNIINLGNTLSINSDGAALIRSTSLNPLHVTSIGLQADLNSATGSLMARTGFLAENVSTLNTTIGSQADVANPVGSLMARLRALLVDTFGATADAANADTTLMGRLRLIAQSYDPVVNSFTRSGATGGTASVVDTISGTPARLLRVYAYNKASATRFLQFFNRTTNPVSDTTVSNESFAIPPNSVLILGMGELGFNGLHFSSGLAWAFSTTENVYTAAQNIEVTVNIKWRSA